MLSSTIVFIAFLIFFIIIPPLFILNLLQIRLSDEALVNLGMSLIMGIVILSIFAIIMRFLGLGFWTVWLLPIIGLLDLRRKNKQREIKKKFFRIPKRSKIFILLIAISVILQTLVLIRGGVKTDDGFIFPSLHDNMWNIAILKEISYNFPPQNPAFSGSLLKNHHYFYLLFLAVTHYITKISVIDLYYRFGPVLVSLIYGLGLYILSYTFTKDRLIHGLSIILGYFSGNFAFILPIFWGRQFDWKGNTFFSDQPFDQMFNPYSVLGLAMILYIIYAFSQMLVRSNQLHRGWSITASLLIGVLYGFKSFGGVVAIFALGIVSLLYLFIHKKAALLNIFFLTLLIFIPIFFLITKTSTVKLSWYPGWILTEMMVGQDKLNLPNFVQIENYYRAIGNSLGLVKIKLLELLIYLFGNLGIRIFGLGYLIFVSFTKRLMNQRLRMVHLFAFFCFLAAFSIPLFFNLGSSSHNIIQFTPYALVILSVYAAIFTGKIFRYLKQKHYHFPAYLFIALMVVLAIPVNVKNVLGKMPLTGQYLSVSEMAALDYLRNHSNRKEIILLYPKQFGLRDPIYIPALTERQVFLGSGGFAMQTGENPNDRISRIEDFFTKADGKKFLTENSISYIYLFKEPSYSKKYRHIINEVNKVFYENDEVLILRF